MSETSRGSSGREVVEVWVKLRGLSWRFIDVPGSARTVDDAARFLGVSRSSIVKTLIVICSNDIYAAIVPGDRKLDMIKLRAIAGECRLAKPNEVLEHTGYRVGGVPPVTLPPNIKIIVDTALLSKPKVYGGGGDEKTLLEFNPKELVEITGASTADISS